MHNRRNNILAGLFVLLGMGLGVWTSFLLSDRSSFDSARSFIVRFPLASGASGLKRGSSVLLGGQEIGRVLGVDFLRDTTGIPTAVDIRVEVRADLTLYENAAIYLEKPLLGSLSSINIPNPGTRDVPGPRGAGPEIENDEIVAGLTAPPSFLADAGYGPEQAGQLRRTLASLDTTMGRIEKLVENADPRLRLGVNDAQELITQLKAKTTEWSTRIDSTLANLDAASARLDPILVKAEAGVDDAKAALAALRGLIEENREQVNRIVHNVESASAKFDAETIASLNRALTDGRDALGVFSDAVSRVSALVGEQTPNLRRTLANLRLMSDQLKLTAVEVRSQPWRLLHQPTTKEFEAQVLYDATRSYAEAASDLRASSEAMQAGLAIQAAGAGGVPDLESLTATVNESLTKYRQAERYLLDKLVEVETKKK